MHVFHVHLKVGGTASGPVLNARDREFPGFFGKKFGTQKTGLGMQTSGDFVLVTVPGEFAITTF